MAETLHVNRLLESPGELAQYQILCLPGGFSYGDDLGAGRILGNQLRHHLVDWLEQFKAAGKLILGICNGFQILIKSGVLLPLDQDSAAPATLARNDSGKFEDRWVHLHTGGVKSIFFAGIDSLYLPVAHAEGKFVPRSAAVMSEMERNGQLVLRYGTVAEGASVPYPQNPNGSWGQVAAICDRTQRVCGLMPHPERHIDPTQHPSWTRGPLPAAGEGLRVFENTVRFFQ